MNVMESADELLKLLNAHQTKMPFGLRASEVQILGGKRRKDARQRRPTADKPHADARGACECAGERECNGSGPMLAGAAQGGDSAGAFVRGAEMVPRQLPAAAGVRLGGIAGGARCGAAGDHGAGLGAGGKDSKPAKSWIRHVGVAGADGLAGGPQYSRR